MSLMLSFFFSSRRRHTRLQGDWSSDVCSSDLFHEDRHALLVLQVEGDRALVAVQVLEVRAVARPAHRFALDARRRFDLDDVSTEIPELAHAGGPGTNARRTEDAKARRRGGGGDRGAARTRPREQA